MDNAYDMGRKRGQEESRKEIERLHEIIECKDILLIAYRLGTNRGVGKALDKLRALEEGE